jgi:type I restriction enzyme, R subunit
MGLSEASTRRERIDPKLTAAGWKLIRFRDGLDLANCDECAIAEYPTDNGPADYALCVAGRILGIVEAKKLTLGPQNVLTQAERYSRGTKASPFNFGGLRVPFLYSTNGEVIWYHDIRHPESRSYRVAQFHAPDALAEKLDRDFEQSCSDLATLPNNASRLRPYQVEANTAVEQSIAQRKRVMMLAMATGTGKTYTLVNQIYRLMHSGVARRILFLVDRRALAAQAVRSFATFEPEPGLKFDKLYEVYSQRFQRDDFDPDEKFDPKVLPNDYLTNPKPGHTFVYVCTIQRMTINLFGRGSVFHSDEEEVIDEDADRIDIPSHAFDLIVADECHRGYTAQDLSVWRNTLDHFDAIKLGLTATPAAHTMAYFKDIVYRYEYARAVREGYLVDYDPVFVKSDVRLKGVFLKEGETVGVVDRVSGAEQMDLLEDERTFAATEVERHVTSPDSNRKILAELKKYADKHIARYGRFPKMLIFAVNDLPHVSHADQLVEIARDTFGQGDSFVQKITGRVDRPLQRIREFRNRQKPGVVVTVDLLSTGVDIPDLEYIVFLRPVQSRILFEQMLGRGTRKSEKYPDKSHFTVFDCFDGSLLKYFEKATGITVEPLRREHKALSRIVDEIWQNVDREYNTGLLAKRLQRIEKELPGDIRQQVELHIPGGSLSKFAAGLEATLRSDFTDTMLLLRDENFQKLLTGYSKKPLFVVAYGTEDTVTSSEYIRAADGGRWKPEDYLTAFARFVAENKDQVDAISILLERPRNWSVAALSELRKKLASAPEHFTEENLRLAHQVHYHKALVEIISMVKHAVREQEPLLTAEERVKQALAKVTAGREFTVEQAKWLDRIKSHLVENLSISQGDFDLVPVLSDPGGWGRANRDFNQRLDELLKQMNEAVAA